MSNLIEKKSDFNPLQEEILKEFKEAGLPDISSVTDVDVFKAFNLYLSGKGYGEISSILDIKEAKLLFLSEKYSWLEKKNKQLLEVQSKLQDRMLETKVKAASFLMDVVHNTHKKYEKAMQEATIDETKDANLSKKDMELYFKSLDSLDKIVESTQAKKASQQNSPLVSVNIPDGASIKDEGNGTVTVSPKGTLKDILNKKKEQ